MSVQKPSSPTTRWFDILASLLLLAALLTATSLLITTVWIDNLQLTWFVVLLGGVLGIALGYSRLSPRVAFFFALLYGLFILPWLIGLSLSLEIPWLDRLAGMYEILKQTYQQLVSGENVTSALLFLILISITAWALSVYAAYTLTRYGLPWRATIPGVVAMLAIASYSVRDSTNTVLLGLYIFFTLLLVARLSYKRRYIEWRGERAILPGDIGYNMARAIVFFVLLLVLLAWSAPALGENLPSFEESWQEVTKPLDGFRQRMRKAFAPIDSSIGLVNVDVIHDYYGDELPLGRGNTLSDDLILSVEAPEPPPEVPRYYWRARHYDYYEDGKWTSTPKQTRILSPDRFSLELPNFDGRWDTTVEITVDRRLVTIYTPEQPEWVSLPVEIQFITDPDGTTDVVALRATPALDFGDVYSVQASVSAATISDLRSAGTEYPEWITDRYLQIPKTVTSRTIELAQQIAEGKENPYDAAVAVTGYLRKNIQYKEYLPELPKRQDPIDWLLFDQRQGFCNYYASAEVILLRSLGIPARVTVGYAQGEIDSRNNDSPGSGNLFLSTPDGVEESSSDNNIYKVRQRDAHAWPEVYFPGYGWLEFEPTVNQTPLVRPLGFVPPQAGEDQLSPQSDDELGDSPGLEGDLPLLDDEIEQFNDQSGLATETITTPFLWESALILGIFVVAYLAWRVLSERDLPPLPILLESLLRYLGIKLPPFLKRWVIRASLPPVASAYNELNRALVRMGARPSPAATPNERAADLALLLPDAKDQAEIVVDEYQDLTYSPRSGDLLNALRASRIIRRLSYKALVQRLIAPFYKTNP